MIRLTLPQLEALDAVSPNAFVARAAARLRVRCPAQAAGLAVAALDARIREAIDRAEAQGIDDEAQVLRYLELELRHGPRFDTRADWARAILAAPGVWPEGRLAALEEYETFVLARAVRKEPEPWA